MNRISKNKKIKIIDLFSGIGGIRLGFELASPGKIQCVFSSEIDKYCMKTYDENFKKKYIFGDITTLKTNKNINDEIPDFDLLLAGFPCQPFSKAGKRMGFEDSRGTLFFNIAKILKTKKPKAFLLENVKGLTYKPMKETFNSMINILEEKLRYHIKCDILNAKDFGLPQNRERLFIVGFLNEKEYSKFSFPNKLNLETKVGDILDSDRYELFSTVDEKYTISDKLWDSHKKRKIRNMKNGKGFGYSSVNHSSKSTRTLSARYYKDGGEILIEQKNKNPRMLTRNECKRLQGFPETFILPEEVSDVQIYKQFGNSVSVPVIKAIAKKMITSLR